MKPFVVIVGIVAIAAAYYFYAGSMNTEPDTSEVVVAEETNQAESAVETTAETNEVETGQTVEEPAEAEAVVEVDAETEVETPVAETVVDTAAEAEARVFAVEGFNFGYDQSEIRVKEGETVTINFVSVDGFHDWVVDEFNAATEKVRPGTPTSVTFVADKAGSYEFYCSVGSHRANGMVGTLIVE